MLELNETAPILNIDKDGKIAFSKGDILKNISDAGENFIEIGKVKSNIGTITKKNSDYTLEVPKNFNGTIELLMKATDGYIEVPKKALITVQLENNNLKITFINPSFLEDEGVIVNLNILDVESTTVEVFQSSNNGNCIINTDRNLEYTPVKDYNGAQEITIKISDGNSTTYKTVEIEVSPVKDKPSIKILQEITIDKDSEEIISFDMQNINDDIINFEVYTPNKGIIIVDGSQVTYIPNENYNGTDVLTIKYTDGIAQKTSTVNINVQSVDNKSYINVVNGVHMVEDKVQEVLITVGNFEGLSIFSAEADNGVCIVDENGNIVYSPNVVYNETETIVISATDADSVTVSKNVNVQIDKMIDKRNPYRNG